MLTEQAARDRKWGPFPALRRAVEDKSIPDSYYGPTSVSDNMFDALHRLVEIAILAHEYRRLVEATARGAGAEAMRRDLDKLEGEIQSAISFLTGQAENIRALRSTL